MSNKPDTTVRADQVAPHSIEAEKAVIGSILISGSDALLSVMGFLKPDDFFLVRHAWMYEAALSLLARKDPIDYLMMVNELEQKGHLAEVGGAAYLLGLINETPSSMNVEGYARVVVGMGFRRRLIDVAGQLARMAHSDETDTDTLRGKAEAAVFKATQGGQVYRTTSTRASASRIYDQTVFKGRAGYIDQRIYSYMRDLDRLIGGFCGGDLILIGGRAGMGKTAWGTSLLASNAREGHKGGMVTLEMDVDQITMRLIGAEAHIPYQKIRDGEIGEGDEYQRFVDAVDTVAGWNIPIDETPFINPFDLRSILRRMVYEDGIEFAVVDYVQLMSGGPGYGGKDSRVQEVSFISRMLKQIARELMIPIFGMVQLSRALESRKDKRPILSDLRESGSLEQDADIVIFPYRNSYYSKDETDNITEMAVAKNRHGRVGMIETVYLKERMEFVDAIKTHIELNAHLDAPMLLDTGAEPAPLYNGHKHRSNGADDDDRRVYRG